MDQNKKRAQEIVELRDSSREYMSDNYYDEWAKVLQSYRCERDMEKDDDGNDDPTQTSIATPLTAAYTNRMVARITAQPPKVALRSKNKELAEMLSRSLMYQWDKSRVQRLQKKHVRQAVLFGWSVRAWSWHRQEFTRRKRVDPFDTSPATLEAIDTTYGEKIQQVFSYGLQDLWQASQRGDLEAQSQIAMIQSWLAKEFARGSLIPITYMYQGYSGPRPDFVSIADCYPEPGFTDIQSSNWFIRERRRTKQELEDLATAFPEFQDGLNTLKAKHPKGTIPKWTTLSGSTSKTSDFRSYMARAYSSGKRFTGEEYNDYSETNTWSFTEIHMPGQNAKLGMVAEDEIFIGEIPYPSDLDSKVAFTELILTDDIVGGVGESVPRFFRGIQATFDRQQNVRWDLVDKIQRPMIGTTDRELIEDPSKLNKGKGYRLVHMKGGAGSLWVQPEQAAIAAAAAGMQHDGGLMMLYQMITGENNMSLNANVEPRQSGTATGARIMAYNQDVISLDAFAMFTETCLKPDVEMMYLLNRSEQTDNQEFDAGPYNRRFVSSDPMQEVWMTVEPKHWQTDDIEIDVEAGSTLSDDDELKMQKTMQLVSMLGNRPNVNQDTLRDAVLIAHGKGNEIQKWAAPPPPPEPPPPPAKANISIPLKLELVPPELQGPVFKAILREAGITVPELEGPPPPQPGMGPEQGSAFPPTGAPGVPPPGVPTPANNPTPSSFPAGGPGMGAMAAAKGRNPITG